MMCDVSYDHMIGFLENSINTYDMLVYKTDSYMHNSICNNHAVPSSCNEDWHWCSFLHHHRFRIAGMIYDNIDSYKLDSCYTHQWWPMRHSIDYDRHNFQSVELVLGSAVLAVAWAYSLVVVLVCLLVLELVLNHMDKDDSTEYKYRRDCIRLNQT